jgi:serine/threonine-protein kinase
MGELLQPNQIVAGRYRVERLLAEGGMGAVYVAEHVATEARVALKMLWAHTLGSRDAVSKFEVEAKVAARVNSEHIVRVLDAGFDPQIGAPFMVMELLNGESLEERVARAGPLPPDEVVAIMQQVSMGLDKAHGHVAKDGTPQPIVHRDLKPENLFLSRRESGELVVKILDFGIAKILSQGTKLSQEVKGTPLFMAYEQGAGKPVTPGTDIWAFGLIAFYLLTGKPYWRTANDPEGSLVSLMGEVLSLPLEPACQRAAELGVGARLPPAFDAFFAACVTRDPAARFASAGAAAEALTVVLAGQEAATAWAARRMRAGSDVDARPGAVAPTRAMTAPGTRDGMALSSGATRARRGPAVIVAAVVAVVVLAALGGGFLAFRSIAGREPAARPASELVVPPAPSSVASAEPASSAPRIEASVSGAVAAASASAPGGGAGHAAGPAKSPGLPPGKSGGTKTKGELYDDR